MILADIHRPENFLYKNKTSKLTPVQSPPMEKRTYIHLDSKSLGDTLAWFPYVEQFRVENKCKVKLFLPKQAIQLIQY